MSYSERGEVWLIDLGLMAKVRPCVIVSTRIGDSDRALITVVPHTTSTRGTRFEAVVPARFLRAGAFDAQGIVTVPPARAARRLGMLTSQQLSAVEAALCRWLSLPHGATEP